jgi:probable F420-dependent oxidoreductase
MERTPPSSRLQVGILLPTREAIFTADSSAAPLLALAERAEALGFDSLWVGDSLTARPRFEPLSILAAVAARTRRVALGTAVLLPTLRNPVLLAHAVASVDRIAEGRLILGVGLANKSPASQAEFRAAGVPFEHRGGRLKELLHVCRALWSEDKVSFQGRFWQFDSVQVLPKPHRPGGPPIWIGGGGPIMLGLAAGGAEGWFPNMADPALLRSGWDHIGDVAKAAGRSRGNTILALYVTVNLQDDPRRAERALREFIERYYLQPYEAIAKRQGSFAGSAEGAVAWLRPFLDVGVTHLVLRFGGTDQAEQLERAAKDLLPRLGAVRQ